MGVAGADRPPKPTVRPLFFNFYWKIDFPFFYFLIFLLKIDVYVYVDIYVPLGPPWGSPARSLGPPLGSPLWPWGSKTFHVPLRLPMVLPQSGEPRGAQGNLGKRGPWGIPPTQGPKWGQG